MRPMLTLTVKDLLLLWRNKAALFWVIAFPLAFGLFYGAIISRNFEPAKMSIAFVDEDKSAVSNALAQKLSAHANVRLVQTQADGQPHDRDSATQSVRSGDLTAYLLLHPGFGKSLSVTGDHVSPPYTGRSNPWRKNQHQKTNTRAYSHGDCEPRGSQTIFAFNGWG